MIGASLQKDSRARSNTASLLALFLGLSVFMHGLYYPQEWLIFGFVLSAYHLSSYLPRRVHYETGKFYNIGLTDTLLLGFVLFSLLGIVHPIKQSEGLLEALQWGILWLVYRLGVRISSDDIAKRKLIQYIEWLAIAIAVIGWLPWVSKVGGRLSSVFGYPNAAAAFLGVVLLLHPRSKLVLIWLAISLLGTGSRAGVGLTLIILVGRQMLLRGAGRRIHFKGIGLGQFFKGMFALLVGCVGTVLILLYYRPAWDNLTAWGFSSSSWQERLVYIKDGISLAWNSGGLPQAGGWWAFPTVQSFPYWTADPHSSFIHILLNQGVLGIASMGIWGSLSLAQVWKTWGKNQILIKSGVVSEDTKAQLCIWSALLFLVLHSLVDANFSFGALGILFWLLFGCLQRKHNPLRTHYYKQNIILHRVSKIGVLVVSFMVCLICGGILLNPTLLEREHSLNKQAVQCQEQDPNKSVDLWGRSLELDQTQIEVRRGMAEHLLRQGNLLAGLETVKEVLRWQAFDLEAYEWGQSVVWDAAEASRQTKPELAITLYRWVEDVPKTIEERMVNLNSLDRKLWQGHKDFLPSQHIRLLSDYARQRQLTKLLPQHKL
ncbi:MAG TPA: hypothetical protein DEF42_08890 [Desulfosporosinus sp.]|nr:hypothetical protein [Desulfosporosinus sp.]